MSLSHTLLWGLERDTLSGSVEECKIKDMYVAFFLLAVISESLTIQWHRYREDQRVALAALVSMALEGLSWLPLWFALTTEDWRVATASVLGSGVGTGWAIARGGSSEPS